MTRDEKIKKAINILAYYRTMPYLLEEGAEIARELLAGMAFESNLRKNQQGLPEEFSRTIDEHFWELDEGGNDGEDA